MVHLLSFCEPKIVFFESLVILGTLRKNNCQWTAVQTRSPKQGSVANEARFSADGCTNISTARLRLTDAFPTGDQGVAAGQVLSDRQLITH